MTAETIVVKSEADKVAFVPLEIRVTNKPMTGTICYENADNPIPQGANVDIITQRNGTRIGAFVIGQGGAYTLRLKGEFDFGWAEALHVMYKADDGAIYQLSTTLDEIKRNDKITLTK